MRGLLLITSPGFDDAGSVEDVHGSICGVDELKPSRRAKAALAQSSQETMAINLVVSIAFVEC